MNQSHEEGSSEQVAIVELVTDADDKWFMVLNTEHHSFQSVSKSISAYQLTGEPFYYQLTEYGNVEIKPSSMANSHEDWIGPVRVGQSANYRWFTEEAPIPEFVGVYRIEEVNTGVTGRAFKQDGTLAQPACANCVAFQIAERKSPEGYQFACKPEHFVGICKAAPPTAKAGDGYQFPVVPGDEYCASYRGLAPGAKRWKPSIEDDHEQERINH